MPLNDQNADTFPTTPSRKFTLGLNDNSTGSQIQQIKQATVNPNSTQGVPQPVQNVSVSRTALGTTQYKLVISYTVNPADPYFQQAQVYLRQGKGNPVLVGSGQSPVTVTVNKQNLPTTVVVQSVGRWGSTVLADSPAKSLVL